MIGSPPDSLELGRERFLVSTGGEAIRPNEEPLQSHAGKHDISESEDDPRSVSRLHWLPPTDRPTDATATSQFGSSKTLLALTERMDDLSIFDRTDRQQQQQQLPVTKFRSIDFHPSIASFIHREDQ